MIAMFWFELSFFLLHQKRRILRLQFGKKIAILEKEFAGHIRGQISGRPLDVPVNEDFFIPD